MFRQNWGGHKDEKVGVAFVLGVPAPDDTTPELQLAIVNERRQYNDILQLDFVDTYKNLTIKSMAALEWMDRRCRSDFLLLMDDDSLIVIPRIVRGLRKFPRNMAENLYAGFQSTNMLSIKKPQSKWYMSVYEYASIQYPPYIYGAGILMHNAVVRRIVTISRGVPPFAVEDVYIGTCCRLLEIPVMNLPTFSVKLMSDIPWTGFMGLARTQWLVNNLPEKQMLELWKYIEKNFMNASASP